MVRHIATNGVVCVSVCLCVAHTGEPYETCELKNHPLDGSLHWRHIVNTFERSVLGGVVVKLLVGHGYSSK